VELIPGDGETFLPFIVHFQNLIKYYEIWSIPRGASTVVSCLMPIIRKERVLAAC
jgi:hypothetical protein